MDPDRDPGHPDLDRRVGLPDPQIARLRHEAPSGDRVPVDRGDHGRPMQEEQAEHPLEDGDQLAGIDVGEGPQIEPRAERVPLAVEQDRRLGALLERLAELARELSDRLEIVMRVYFEKPRTTIGWRGMIYDPHLNGSYDITEGLRRARHILMVLAALGLPSSTEMLDPIVPQYIAELITWAAIGARTAESQTHREMASGLSMPIGFKNGTDGNLDVAINAMKAAQHPHGFLGIDQDGRTCIIQTSGNPYSHLILRGGSDGPNYERAHVADAMARLEATGLPPRIMIDCSHGNSCKRHDRQPIVCEDAVQQRADGNENIIGLMIESNINEGSQPFIPDCALLKHGISITDACINWETTERLLREAHAKLDCCALNASA